MTKNIHDVAYELQKAIAENEDFKTLKRATQQFKPMRLQRTYLMSSVQCNLAYNKNDARPRNH